MGLSDRRTGLPVLNTLARLQSRAARRFTDAAESDEVRPAMTPSNPRLT